MVIARAFDPTRVALICILSFKTLARQDEPGDERAAFDYLPATSEYGGEYPDEETVKRMFNDAFGTQGKDFYEKPMDYFKQLVQVRFGMSIEKLYVLPIR